MVVEIHETIRLGPRLTNPNPPVVVVGVLSLVWLASDFHIRPRGILRCLLAILFSHSVLQVESPTKAAAAYRLPTQNVWNKNLLVISTVTPKQEKVSQVTTYSVVNIIGSV